MATACWECLAPTTSHLINTQPRQIVHPRDQFCPESGYYRSEHGSSTRDPRVKYSIQAIAEQVPADAEEDQS